ncbi:MAG: hypothetical protein ACR2JQ_12615 [Mycobacteriales bacterium]
MNTTASSPGLAEVGFSARTTLACTNGTRSARSAAARARTVGSLTPAARAPMPAARR